MPGLVLKLRAHEEVLVNGVHMRNGDRNIRLLVRTPEAAILRLSEALSPEEAVTPVTRLCYLAQEVVAGFRRGEDATPDLTDGIKDLQTALQGHPSASHLDMALQALREGKFYGAFRALKKLVPVEADMLSRA